MIRSVPTSATFSFRGGRVGAVAFDPLTAGISAGVGLATSAAALWMNSIQQSHQADTGTTLIVNGLAEQLANLDAAYFAEANPSCADQRAALDAYDQAWLWLQSPQACGNPVFGSAGNRCITDRAPGGPYPFQKYYRDPIANDPRMANLGCDTGQSVLLPSLTAGGYTDTGITSTGGSSASGQPAAPTTPGAVMTVSTPAASPNLLLYAGLGLGALLLAKTL